MTSCRSWKDRAVVALLITGSGMTINGLVASRSTVPGIACLIAGLLWMFFRRHRWQPHRHVH